MISPGLSLSEGTVNGGYNRKRCSYLFISLVICTFLELTDAGEQTPAWKKELEERQRDESFNNALMNRIKQSRGKRIQINNNQMRILFHLNSKTILGT